MSRTQGGIPNLNHTAYFMGANQMPDPVRPNHFVLCAYAGVADIHSESFHFDMVELLAEMRCAFTSQLFLDETLGMARWMGRVTKAQLQPHHRVENLKKVNVSLGAAIARAHPIDELMDGPKGRETMHIQLLVHPKA